MSYEPFQRIVYSFAISGLLAIRSERYLINSISNDVLKIIDISINTLLHKAHDHMSNSCIELIDEYIEFLIPYIDFLILLYIEKYIKNDALSYFRKNSNSIHQCYKEKHTL